MPRKARNPRARTGAAARAAALLVALGLGPAGCAPGDGGPHPRGSADVARAVERARDASRELAEGLRAALGAQLESGAPGEAIEVCSTIAPALAAERSGDGLEIRRTSLRYRNPGNAPDAWERAGLERLEALHAAGELPAEVHEVVGDPGELRYLRPIVVAPACLQCHGAAEALDREVRDRLARHYPDDRATGYAAGDLRGAFSVRVRLAAPGEG